MNGREACPPPEARVRRLARPFCRSAAREEEVIRQRFRVYRNLSAAKLETMIPVSELIDAAVAHVLPSTAMEPTAWN